MPKRQHARLTDDVALAHLRELLADGRIVRHGRGTKGSPFRYEVAS